MIRIFFTFVIKVYSVCSLTTTIATKFNNQKHRYIYLLCSFVSGVFVNADTLLTGKFFIKDLFGKDSFYNIPDYQRSYVWGEEQVLDLLEDISNSMEIDSEREYFLGCMIWNNKLTYKNSLQFECRDILDGQQRFISIYLLHAFLRDISNNKTLKNKVQERLIQEKDEFDGIPERERLIFEVRKDHTFIENVALKEGEGVNIANLTKIVQNENMDISIRNMASALLTMNSWWNDKKSEVEDETLFISSFFKYMSTKVIILYLATSDNLDDAYNLFTVLNSRGLKLTASDILRAQSLRVITNDSKRNKYAERWNTFEKRISKYLDYDLDDFLWVIVQITMQYRSDDNKSIRAAFEFMDAKNKLAKGAATIDEIDKYITHMEFIFSYKNNMTFYNLVRIVSKTGKRQFFIPILYFLELFGDHLLVDFVVKLDNLFSCMWILGKKGTDTRVNIILRKMKNYYLEYKDNKEAAQALINDDVLNIGYNDENANTFMDVNELFNLFRHEKWGLYSGVKINKLKYLLLKLDLLMGNTDSEVTYDSKNSSVEHILPRKPTKEDWNISDTDQEIWLHRLGNLVLLSRKRNSSLSNNAFSVKKEKYKGAIENRVNTNFVFMEYETWNLESIIENHNRVVQLLINSYS